jgi:zinc transport system substrate-binding protein
MRSFLMPFALIAFGQAALADAPTVVTDIAPVHALTTTVLGGRGQADLLLPAGGDPHDFQLRPSQARALADAGLVIWVGAALTPWLARSLDGVGAQGARLDLLSAAQTMTRGFGDDGHAHDDHGHDHDSLDPHAWLDPENGRIWLDLIAEALAQADPAGAAAYRANANAGRAQIDAAEAQARAILAPVKDRGFAVAHDAYGYYADHFGLKVVGAIRMGDAAQPGAAHLRKLQADLQAGGAVCLFPEVNHDPAAAQLMAAAAGLRLGGALDPAGAALAPGAGLYAALIVGMAKTLAACLSQG